MIKFLLKIAIPIIIGLLIYNYFFGTQEEKETSKVVFNKTKDLTVSVYDLLKAEKNKFDEGKYDKAMDKLNDVYDAVKNNGDNYTDAQKSEFKELEAEKEKLQNEINQTKKLKKEEADKKSESIDEKLRLLVEKTSKLFG
ncbi:MAG: hypothetical protein KBF75_01845 [Saprospiraceae bacterium]|nr:hypothetical protein [Saprospiraceae bacterium]HQW96287.1 hypothetical protein [Saprospiraceae bacterium]